MIFRNFLLNYNSALPLLRFLYRMLDFFGFSWYLLILRDEQTANIECVFQARTGVVGANIVIIMDVKGAWRDKRIIERPRRSLKYECVNLNAFETASEMRTRISIWLSYYNSQRPYSTRGLLVSNEAYACKIQRMRIVA